MKLHRHGHPHERGAALVEFIVAATFLLVPMYLALQALGKFADVQHTANAAARYVAWERTVWFDDKASTFAAHNEPNQKTAAQIRSELMVRVLNDRRAALKYTDADKGAADYRNGLDPLWHDAAGTDYISDPARLTLALADEKPSKDLLGTAIGLINAISVPRITGTLAPPVPTKTLAVTSLQLQKVGADSDVYKRLWSKAQGLPDDWTGLDFDGRSGILSNSWVANAREGTERMVGSSVPTASALGDAVEAAARLTLLNWDWMLLPRLELGKVAPDVVPDDRKK